MDHAEVNRRFVDDFLTALKSAGLTTSNRSCRVLDIGTGTAQIPIELVRRARETNFALPLEITAVDLAAECHRHLCRMTLSLRWACGGKCEGNGVAQLLL
jgi:methylase of polypeptide subunit release factors